jgi:GDP-4-dehydro-6-deoxy-D-mannose reductase
MRALITGGFGFAGRHLAQYLVKCGDDVALSYLPSLKPGGADERKEAASYIPLPPSIQSLALDVADAAAVGEVVALLKPDAIYHLAAMAFVPDAEQDLKKVFDVNAFGTINVLDAVAKFSRETRVLVVSSAEVYGEPRPGSLPLTELATLRPISAYGMAKATADLAGFKYAFLDGLHTVRVRPFNHIGPGQSESFAISSFAKQVAAVKLGMIKPVIKVGDLEVKRDYSDVSDIVRGYREALLNGKRGDAYNLCSGTSVAISELLEKLIKVAEVEATIEVDPERVRPVLIPDIVGSSQKAQKEFGWKPRIDLEGTLHSLFAFWLETLSSSSKK